jgi:hypothetical protein
LMQKYKKKEFENNLTGLTCAVLNVLLQKSVSGRLEKSRRA